MECLCLNARRAARMLTRIYDEALLPSGLTATQFGLLSLLTAQPGMTQAQIARKVDSDQTTLSRGLQLLVRKQWVRASPSASDARRVLYALTPEGRARHAAAVPLWKAVQEEMKERLGKRFDKALAQLQKAAKE